MAMTALAVSALIARATLQSPESLCGDLERILNEADSGFLDIEGDVLGELASAASTTFDIAGASSCSITRDVERASYQCDWEYPLGGEEAPTAFAAMVEDVEACLSQEATSEDGGVNHPDFFAAQYFETSTGQISVSLKDKNTRNKAFVTLGVDRL